MPYRRTSTTAHPSALGSLGLLLLGFMPACAPKAPEEANAQGLVLLPYEGPLAKGVEKLDPRLNFHDFGRVPDGEVATRLFQLRNTDPTDVSITRVDPGCGCTVAALRVIRSDGSVEKGLPIRSKEPKLLTVGPDEVAEIEIQIRTGEVSTKNKDKLITMRVMMDSPNRYFLTLEAHILVEQPFTVLPRTLAFGDVPENGGGRTQVEIVPSGNFFYALKEVLPTPEGIRTELVMETRNGGTVWVLTADIDPPLERGLHMGTLRLSTEEAPGVPGRDVEVPYTATGVSDFLARPSRIVFATTRDSVQRSSCTFRSLLTGQRLKLKDVEIPAEQRDSFSVQWEPVDPDDDGSSLDWLITLETRPPLPAQPDMLAGNLVLHLDDKHHPTHELEYVVHLR